MLGCDDKSMLAVSVEKTEFLQSGTATPKLATVPPTLPPLPLANKWGCTFAEPLFGVSVVGGEGLATPDQESSTSVCQDHGQPECTEELLRARHVRARPAPARGFRAEPSWRCGLLLQGQAAPASSHCLGWWSRGGKLEARRCPGLEVGHRDIGNIPLPSLRSLPRGCPAQHPDWGVPETGAMEGTVRDACCWGTSREEMEWGAVVPGSTGPAVHGSAPAAASGRP